MKAKLNKILGIAVATLGVAGSIGLASALYVTGASDVSMNIGATYEETVGSITYKMNNTSSSGMVAPEYVSTDGTKNDGTGLGGEYSQIHFKFELSAEYASNVPAQSFTVGNFKLEISGVDETLINNSKIWMQVKGYQADSVGEDLFAHAFMTADDSITAATYSKSADIAVASSGGQYVDVYFKVTDMSALDLLALDEASSMSVTATWTAASDDYSYAYVVGGGTMWAEDDAYRMVPNINKAKSEGYEWMFSNLSGAMGTAKAKKGDTWSSGDNATLDGAKTYTVYWNGSGSSNAYFAEN